MMKEEKIVWNFVIIFVIIFGLLGLIAGTFFNFFPGSFFILLVSGIFVGLVLGFIVGTIVKITKVTKEKDKYKI